MNGYIYVEEVLENKLKIKPLTRAQIVISLDRLTRFKHTEDKYLRVFKDILSSNLLCPKFKKRQLDLMDYEELTSIAQQIINSSLGALNIDLSGDFTINKKLMEYEKSVFKIDENILKLLNNRIDFEAACAVFDAEIGNPPYENGLPLNLKWLITLSEDVNSNEKRAELGLRFPVEKVVIVEGITEEILLPKFAKIGGYDFDKMGVNLISAGGKNQVVKLFYQFYDTLQLPIFVLLDSDAGENYEEIAPKLGVQDKVHVLKSGEFEDLLPLNLIKRTLNRYFRNYSSVLLEDLRQDISMTKILDGIFKQRGMEFKKAEFASLIGENISSPNDISSEIEEVLKELF